MDDSQSSDFLSESTDMFCNSSAADSTIMDPVTYKSLVSSTKATFSSIRKEIKKTTFAGYFSSLLEDCGACISQSLDFITELLSEPSIKLDKLKEYMNDAVSLLHSLSDLIKNLIESVSMSCSSLKTFPTITGRIIMLVFRHCKDSSLRQLPVSLDSEELCQAMSTERHGSAWDTSRFALSELNNTEMVYGSRLNSVEKQIKDLFRSCHELQLTYLMVMEKQYIFDLTQREEQDILIEALDINLKTGEIVQSLDVKTMAEQWKAYTVICEKYSCHLMDKRIYNDCNKILCGMVTNNVKTALEANQEDKVIVRSLKVSSFTLKILLRVCITFKNAVVKDYDSVVELLLYVNLNNDAYLQTMGGKSTPFINLFNNNVMNPVNSLLGKLLYDDKLLQCICNYDIDKIKREDKLLGLIHLVISIIRSLLQKGGDQLAKFQKHRLINAIYSFLPHCHVWFNMDLKFKCEVKSSRVFQTYGLYEHLLTHTVTLASMMIIEEINILEKRMLEAVLSTDCVSAMFSANLWTLLARMSSRQFLLSQVISLCKIYQTLENNTLFNESPQKVHLSHTISRLFEFMSTEDKMKIYNMLPVREDRNIGLWICLEISNLPDEVQCNAEEIVIAHFKTKISKIIQNENVDINAVIKLINLASTCSHMNREEETEYYFIQAWSKACPNNMNYVVKDLDRGTLWYYQYIEALISLTESMEYVFLGNSVIFIKTLHIISRIVHSGSKELKLLVVNILCKLANLNTNDVNKHVSDSILTRTFSELFDNTDSVLRNKLFNTLRRYKGTNVFKIVADVVNEDNSLKEAWSNYIRHGCLKIREDRELKDHLQSTMDFEYSHKCMEYVEELRDSDSLSLQKSLSNNFEIDIDSLFDAEVDEEPACKKAKLNINEVKEIITRLETDASLLGKIKENVFTLEYKNRIKTVCNKLHNIID